VDLILKYVRNCKHYDLHPDANNFFPSASMKKIKQQEERRQEKLVE
jgi:hypothetical protein